MLPDMRVLFLLDTLNRGGAEIQALDVSRNAHDYGIELTVVTAGNGLLESDFRESGVDFVRLNRKFPVDIYYATQLRKIIRDRRIEIVHGHQAVDGIHLNLAARGLRDVKHVLSFHGYIADRKNRLSLKFLIPRTDANVVVSRGLQKYLAEQNGLITTKNFSVIHTGADSRRLTTTGRSVKKELGIAADSLVFGMIAGFYRDPRKDQLTVCKALPAVFEEFPNAHCIFAGRFEDGAEGKAADCINFCIENNIIDKVHFIGGRSDIPDILSSLDIFVLSSLQEGLPVAVSEAMLAGVPMILSDIEPLLEASGNGKYAEIFPVGDADKLASKMIELGSDAERRTELSTKAKTFAEDNFSISSHMRELKKLYQSLLTS